MRTVDFDDIPEVDFESIPDEAPKTADFDSIPEVDFDAIPDQAPSVTPPSGPVPDMPAFAAGEIPPVQFDREALPPGMAPAQAGATGTWQDPATGSWTPDATFGQKAGAVGKGLVAGATANTYQPEITPGTEGYFTAGNIPGMLAGGAASALGGPPGVAGFAYLAFLNDLKARGMDPSRLTEPEIQALAAASGIAAEVIPGAFGKSRLQNVGTGAAMGAGQNVAQEAVVSDLTDTDPEYGVAAALGGAMGAGVGLVHAPLPRRATRYAEAQDAPTTIQVEPERPAVPEVDFESIPETAPVEAAPQEFDDAAVEAAYAAQYEPQAVTAPNDGARPPQIPEVEFDAIPETDAAPAAPPPAPEPGLSEALTPDYQRLAIRIARQQPNLSEEEAMAQAFILQRGDTEATRRGAGPAVESRRIEYQRPPEKETVADRGERGDLSLNEYLYAQKPKIFLSDDVRDQMGFWDGPAGYKKPRSLRAIREEYGDLFTLDPKGAKLERLAESIREEAETGRLQLAGINGRDVDYLDVVNALSDGPPERRAPRAEREAEELRTQGYDEATLSGRAPGFEETPRPVEALGEGVTFDGQNIVGPDGEILFQKTTQRDLFGEEGPVKGGSKPKIEQTDMFGNEGRQAGGLMRGGQKGLEETPLQRQTDQAEGAAGQERLLQEGEAKATDEARAYYGTTPFHKQGGYMTPEGDMLNFGNGGREVRDQRRTRGHEDVGRFYQGTPAAKARDFFMEEGNIRLYPEAGAIELRAPLTESQRRALSAWFRKAADDHSKLQVEVIHNGKNNTQSYPSKIAPERILSDIEARFAGQDAKPLSELQAARTFMQEGGAEREITGYHLIDKETGKLVREYGPNQAKVARRTRDRMDNDYGAYRYRVDPIYKQGDRPVMKAPYNEQQGPLPQERGKVTKGQIQFLDDGSSTITIFSKYADFSTLMHEYGHWLRRNSLTEAESAKIQKWLKGQKVKVLDEDGRWTREAEERFARAFERYLRDRTAPTPELKGVFEKLRQFMRLVYKQAKENVLGKEIPPEIRKVFDDLLGFSRKEDGPQVLKQEGMTPREKRADLQKKEEAFRQPMALGAGERGQPPPKGRPQERNPGLKGGVQEFTDKRLASPADGPNRRGEAPTGQTTTLGSQQPISAGLQGESFAGKRNVKGEAPTGQTTKDGAQQPLSPGLQGPGEASKAPPPKTPIRPGDVGGLEARWDVPDETRFDYFLRRVQDKMRPLKLMQRAIAKGGRRILESTDAYLAEELYHGKAGAALRNANKESVDPILKAMKEGGLDLKQVDEFLYARHAEERNAQIARINADPDKGSGMTDAEAKAILDKAKEDGTFDKLDAIGEMVDELNQKRLEVLEASGLISEETRKTWESTYKHYVPLKGFAEAADTPEGVMDYHLGKGFDMRGPESKRALGRESLADSPLATAIAQMNESIVRAHKNQVTKTFLKLVLDNPNKDIWEVNKTEFKQSLENGVVVQKQVVNKTDPNVVTAKVLGKEYYIIVKPKYTALAQAMKNMGEEKSGFIVQTLGKVNRVLALINTTLSPEFVLANFMRDVQTAGINLAGEKGNKFAAKVAKDALPALRGSLQGIRESKVLTPSKSMENWTAWYKRFEKAGGKTEYLGLRSVDDIKSEFESKLGKPSTWGKSKEGIKWLATQMEDMNSAVENSIRLSAFKNAVEAGLSEGKAASLAKNLTVNFNRKGELGTLANSLYLFFNANVQGSARIMAAMAKPNTPAGKRLWTIASGLTASAYGLAEWNRAVAGEDEDGINRYDKIAPFVKERNLIFMLPNSKGEEVQALTIPVPYGYNVFKVVGESISSWMHGGTTLDAGLHIGQTIAGAFNPLGSEASQSPTKWLTKMATPTVADPIVQYAMNEAFTGAPIKPENLPYGTPKPESQLAFKSVSPMARGAAEALNRVTGGSEYRSGKVDVSPEALEHFITSYTGSLGKFIYNTIGYAGGVATGKDPGISKTPFARRFFMGESEYFDQKAFADNARDVKPFLEEVKHLSGEEGNKFEAEFGPQIEMAQMASSIQKQVERLNKQAKGIRGDKEMSDSAREAELKTIEAEKKKLFREFNREVQARKKAPVVVPALP